MSMSQLTRALNSPYVLWAILALPGVLMTERFVRGVMFYGEFMHATGELSARLIIVTLALTPLRLLWPRQRWTSWMLRRRRYFGLAAFGYALPHLIADLVKLATLTNILPDSLEPGIWTGWLALLLFVPLAITSNNSSVRKLGSRWKSLHRLVYFAALFTFAHWVLVAFDPMAGILHAAVLAALEGYRIWKIRQPPGSPTV